MTRFPSLLGRWRTRVGSVGRETCRFSGLPFAALAAALFGGSCEDHLRAPRHSHDQDGQQHALPRRVLDCLLTRCASVLALEWESRWPGIGRGHAQFRQLATRGRAGDVANPVARGIWHMAQKESRALTRARRPRAAGGVASSDRDVTGTDMTCCCGQEGQQMQGSRLELGRCRSPRNPEPKAAGKQLDH
jgi:hypothetical protein